MNCVKILLLIFAFCFLLPQQGRCVSAGLSTTGGNYESYDLLPTGTRYTVNPGYGSLQYCYEITNWVELFIPARTPAEFMSYIGWAGTHSGLSTALGCTCGDGVANSIISSCSGGWYWDGSTWRVCPEGCDLGAGNLSTCDPGCPSPDIHVPNSCGFCNSYTCQWNTIVGGFCNNGITEPGCGETCDFGPPNGTNGNGDHCHPGYLGGSCNWCDANCQLQTATGGECGDGNCNAASGEDAVTCFVDCCNKPGQCGDGNCNRACGERVDNCPVDCKNCGDWICTGTETYLTCPCDCCDYTVCVPCACSGFQECGTNCDDTSCGPGSYPGYAGSSSC